MYQFRIGEDVMGDRERDIVDLVEAQFEGSASGDERAALIEKLDGNDSELARFRTQSQVDAMLSVVMEEGASEAAYMERVMGAIRDDDGERFSREVIGRIRTKKRWLQAAAVVAMTLFISGVWLGLGSREPMAEVSGMQSVVWGAEAYDVGDEIKQGGSVEVKSGLLQVGIDEKRTLIVEGPARVTFKKAAVVEVDYGRVMVRSEEGAGAYRVVTPRGAFEDFGQAVGVAVTEGGEVETHVLDGSVVVVNEDGEKVKVEEALRMESGESRMLVADRGQFYTSLPPEVELGKRSISWSFDEGAGDRAAARGSDGEGAEMVFKSMDGGGIPEWVEGPYGGGLLFDGVGSYAESRYRGVAGSQARTVSFWLKVPEDFSVRQGFGIISWGVLDNRSEVGKAWQISVNPIDSEGPVGRLRLGLGLGQVVGTKDLRDGQWHHVAVVLYGGAQVDVGTHVLFYIDGQLEPVSRRALQAVDTEIADAKHGVWLGRNVSYQKSDPGHAHGGFFRGAIDELQIFDTALDQDTIRGLMQEAK
ncbi:LamG domain-containing protein [Rubritalea tangerina]|uniref:LamG domain-containing protein n=1 Tax=Rubritalea tangerina TaxID=430798 RepID=A0ABW4ZEZ0_9BACT